jgi:hypothetical protein
MKKLTTSLFIIGAAVAVSACGTGTEGGPYYAEGRTAGHTTYTHMEKTMPMAQPAAVRSERVFKATQSK